MVLKLRIQVFNKDISMTRKHFFRIAAITLTFAMASSAYAVVSNSGFYVSADAGLFQGNFNYNYIDQTDVIQQNISESVQQHGYTEGLAIGYSKLVMQQYLLGGELSGNLDSHSASFQSGASTAAFSDSIKIKNHIDLVFVPGILLTDSLACYLKLGVSSAQLQDNLTSPAGFTPTLTNYNSNKRITGFAAGLGITKYITTNFSIFAEGNYHDYGAVNFANFQNFSATYTHAAHVYSAGVVLGATYHV